MAFSDFAVEGVGSHFQDCCSKSKSSHLKTCST